jgi:hypothetical protein
MGTRENPAPRRVNIDGTMIPYDDATETVTLERSLEDLRGARAGDTRECMDARCIHRLRKTLPHPVLGVAVTKTRVYVFDSEDHVIRYVLDGADSDDIDRHDIRKTAETGSFVLRPPYPSDRAGTDRRTGRGDRPRTGANRPKTLHAVGSNRRRVAAVLEVQS